MAPLKPDIALDTSPWPSLGRSFPEVAQGVTFRDETGSALLVAHSAVPQRHDPHAALFWIFTGLSGHTPPAPIHHALSVSAEEEKLLKLLTRLIQDFEQRWYQIREAEPLEVLHHLMESRGVKQSQLWEVFGSKGIASEVLSGKRGISKTHARALANYFHVPADLFV